MRTPLALAGLLLAVPALAQAPPGEARTVRVEAPTDAEMSPEARAAIVERVSANIDSLRALGRLPEPPASAAAVSLGWPLRAANGLMEPGVHGISNYVDLNPAIGQLLDFSCGARTYDRPNGYNHAGTDFFTWPFGWQKMDNDQVEVVAAAEGVIIYKSDGRPDRSCAFNNNLWNAVYVRHSDGSVAWYGHLKNGSLTTRAVGETIPAGERIGVVGSSGNSTGPHLHFELYANQGQTQLVEPWAGACNSTTPASWWAAQRPYIDGAVNAARTHSAPPALAQCPGTIDQTNEQDFFSRGQTAVVAAYLRDVRPGERLNLVVRQPNGVPLYNWFLDANIPELYTGVYWYWEIPIPANAMHGLWSWEVEFLGTTASQLFSVGTVDAEGGPGAGVRALAVAPNPVRGDTRVTLRLAETGRVAVDVVDPLGRVVARLHDGLLAADAEHTLALDATGLPSGTYLVRVQGDGVAASRRITVVR